MIIACVLVRGNVRYTTDYVRRLKSMVARSLSRSHRFVCLSDRVVEGVETIAIPSPPSSVPGWWSKLELFNPARGLRGPGIYLDLDALVVDSLDPIAAVRSDLALIPHSGSFAGARGRAVVKQYNSSVMRLEFGAHPELWTKWNLFVTRRLWGDQDWIGEQLPGQPMMPRAWFPRLSECGVTSAGPCWPRDARVVLCKVPKNHEAVEKWPWFNAAWR